MKKIFYFVLLCSVLLGANAAQAANIVTNGDFSAGGSGWSLSGNTGWSSFPGYWSDGAVGGYAYLSQTLNTSVGATYALNFDYFTNSSGPQIIGAIWNGTTVFSDSVSHGYGNWITQAIPGLVATSNQTVLTFFNRNDPSYNGLDNVSVEQTSVVPVPPSILLLASGLLGLGFSRRKQTQA